MSWEEWFAEQIPNEGLRLDLWQRWRLKYRHVKPGEDFKLTEQQLKRARRDREWRRWIERALRLEVDIKPNGRAIVRDPLDQSSRVEVQWEYLKGEGQVPLSVHIYAERDERILGDMSKEMQADFKRWLEEHKREVPFLAWNPVGDLDQYLAACQIRFDRDRDKRRRLLPRSRPLPGEPANISFYAGVVDRYEQLVDEGHAAPVQEIAGSMNTNPSTVKSWLHRGRKYLEKGT